MRTKTQIRNSKSKGSSFEYDVQASIQQSHKDAFRTSERGFQLQYDIQSDDAGLCIECKRLKSLSWNQAKKFFLKLKTKAKKGYMPVLVFKSNNQPCLTMGEKDGKLFVLEFENLFGVPFIKHASTRNR